MDEYETLLVSTRDHVTTVTLNRPHRRNAMNPQMHFDMLDVLARLEHDDDCRVVVFTGSGGSFCAGQDMKESLADVLDDPVARSRVQEASRAWRAHKLRLFPKPTIAAVNGYCIGGAFTFLASCDLAYAADSAVFGISEVNFGQIAGGYIAKSVHEMLHPRDALYYIMTGETFGAAEALRMRLLNGTSPDDELLETVGRVAAVLSTKNPVVLRATKEAYKYMRDMNWEEAGAWLSAKANELSHLSGDTWRAGIEQFNAGRYRPGLGTYDWTSPPTGTDEDVSR